MINFLFRMIALNNTTLDGSIAIQKISLLNSLSISNDSTTVLYAEKTATRMKIKTVFMDNQTIPINT